MYNVELHKFSGTHYEIGFQQGRVIKNILKEALTQIPNFSFVKHLKPRLLPLNIFLLLAKNNANKKIGKDIFKYYPNQAKKLMGISKGAQIDIKTLLLIQASELLLTIKKSEYYLEACTSIGFHSDLINKKETIIAKNFDYPNEFFPFQLTTFSNPEDTYKTLGCKMAPLPGILDGINEKGLSISYNLAYSNDIPRYFIPISIVLQELLETCKNTKEAIEFISKSKRGGNALLIIGDANDNIKSVEITPNDFEIYETNKNYLINTNHYQSQKLKKIDIPKNAVYSLKAPKQLQGIKVHESSHQRYKRTKMLLERKEIIDENYIKYILKDHGLENKPSSMTICRHDDHTSTLRSIILYPNKKKIKVLYGSPCENNYYDFSFQ